MVDQPLLEITTRRLTADAPEGARWPILVLAAFGGQDALAEALDDGIAPALDATTSSGSAPRAFLSSITVEGFRGIGPRQTLQVRPGPGLTLVVGRNGSGKSSLAEALELLLTGSNWRWAERSKVWRDGWRNLHHPVARVSASFAVDRSAGELELVREWAADAALDAGAAWSQATGEPRASIGATGWGSAAETYRPILSYNELGSMFDEGPTALHDRLARILGLGHIDSASKALRDQRLVAQRELKDQDATAEELAAELEGVDDARAKQARTALQKRRPDLATLSSLVAEPSREGDGDIGALRQLALLAAPDPTVGEEISRRAEALVEQHRQLRASAAFDTDRLVQILRLGLEHFEEHGPDDCPMCGRPGALDSGWAEGAKDAIVRAESSAAAVSYLRAARSNLLRDLRALIGDPPAVLHRADGLGLDSRPVQELWDALAEPLEQAGAIPDHVRPLPELARCAAELRREAEAELERREAAWRPVAHSLSIWLHETKRRPVVEAKARDLQTAESWLKGVSADLRRERFSPIADRAMQLWDVFRQQSSVELRRVMLEGSGTMRRVALDVSVDGVDGAALGVMSQGELHSIALSLFLPRATLDESPFRFVVIDDPVQSMDPSRVDGLARVLEQIAQDRQVLVFTHDDRLPEATRRLGIGAVVVQVTRRRNSVVELREIEDPVHRYLSNARALAKSQDVPAEAGKQIVPSFCRLAIEAACVDLVRGRRLRRGEPHADVEDLLSSNPKTAQRMALALFDDASRAGEVGERIRAWGPRYADAWYGATKGAHKGFAGSLSDLVSGVDTLCMRVGELA